MLQGFGLVRTKQDPTVGIFFVRLGGITIKVPFRLRVLPRLGNPPLPSKQDRYEMPQVEFRPHDLQETNLRVLVALPKHEVAETLHPGRTNEHVEGWVVFGEHMLR